LHPDLSSWWGVERPVLVGAPLAGPPLEGPLLVGDPDLAMEGVHTIDVVPRVGDLQVEVPGVEVDLSIAEVVVGANEPEVVVCCLEEVPGVVEAGL